MRNQNKTIPVIDERPKGREGIAEMINRMFSADESDDTEEKADKQQKATA